ncbi:MAG: ABC transporter ATP-binding protein, partial [Nitrososphaerota archaeon]|nr:ABC transporter ATP-binding protein [Nitrososphaerota archaeon]
LALISQAAERLYLMYAGRVVERGPSDRLLREPMHPYTQGLVAATPTLESRDIKGIPGFMPDLARLGEGCSFHPRCPRAMDVCRRERPALRGVGGEGVACWLY